MTPRGIRLQKFLSRAGAASRREAERLMAAGRVRVNGEPALTPGLRVDPDRDRVEVDGRVIRPDAPRWILLNKPRGTVTTRSDPQGRTTVYSLLDPADRGLRYVGRLDLNTEGLVLFTNEGDLVHALLHPSSEIPREYRAIVRGVPSKKTLAMLEAGVELEDGPARAEAVRLHRVMAEKRAVISLVLREGRKREVRRMLRTVGHPVRRLRRERFGPIRLEGIGVGEWRELGTEEVAALHRAAGR